VISSYFGYLWSKLKTQDSLKMMDEL